MNLNALVTTLVLGSSTLASADSFTVSGSVHVSLGGTVRPAPAPAPVVIVRDHRTTVVDPCHEPAPAPVYQPLPPVYQPAPAPLPVYTRPAVWSGPFYQPHNTTVYASSSLYTGWLGTSAIKYRALGNSNSFVLRRTHDQNWFDLTAATRIDSGREFFNIGTDNGMFKTLKLQNLGGGSSNIQRVAIEFADTSGRLKTQVVKLDRMLDRNQPTITIDLDGNYRAIGRIIVYGSTGRGSAYKIQAM